MSEIFALDIILRAKSEGMNALKSAENSLGGMAKAGALAGAVLAGAVVLGALEAYKKTEELGQAAYEMGEKFGLAGGQASAWLAVGEQVGVNAEAVGKGFQILSKNVEAIKLHFDETGKSSKPLTQAFRELHISTFNSNGTMKSANELMLEAADGFAKMKDGPEKAALAMKIFGKSGTDLLPVLNLGRKGIEEMEAKGRSLGNVLSTQQVEAAHKAFLAHKQFDAALQGLAARIGTAVMPVMTRLFDFFTAVAVPAAERLSAWFMEHLWPALQQVWAAAMQLGTAIASFLAPMIDYIRTHIDQLKPVLVAIGIVFAVVLGAVIVVIIAVVIAVVALVAGIVWFAGQTAKMLQAAKGQWDWLVDNVKKVPGIITGALSGMWDFLHDEFKSVANKIVGVLNQLIAAFNSLPHLGLPNLPSLPTFDFGGTVAGPAGQPVLIVAHGGETVNRAGRGGGGGGVTVLPLVFSPIPPNAEQVAVMHQAIRRYERSLR